MARPKAERWPLQPLLFVLITVTWCSGDTQAERFEAARAVYVALHPKRKRPGKTLQGYHQALARLPGPLLRFVASLVRRLLLDRLGPWLQTGGWAVFGCDGTTLACPRAAELEKRLGSAGGKPGELPPVPQLGLSALVHLRTGLLWAWRLAKGAANERRHLRELLPTLPPRSLVVADAGYQGYDLASALQRAGVAFLIRVTSLTTVYLIPRSRQRAARWRQGRVCYWTSDARRRDDKPLLVRLLRVRSKGRKNDVWLLSSVWEKGRLTPKQASRYYALRWENEGFFRDYKQTLKKVKLDGRTVRQVHREAEGSLLAAQLLLAQGAQARLVHGQRQAKGSMRLLLKEVREEMDRLRPVQKRGAKGYQKRLALAQREQRRRTSSKVRRPWPGRKDHKPPRPPQLLTMPDDVKCQFDKHLPPD